MKFLENTKSRLKANDIDLIVSNNLKVKRIFLDIRKRELAESIGVTIQQITKYENGKIE